MYEYTTLLISALGQNRILKDYDYYYYYYYYYDEDDADDDDEDDDKVDDDDEGDDNDDDDCKIMNADEPQISTGFLHAKNFCFLTLWRRIIFFNFSTPCM
jgi:hypothetical protein